MCDIDRIQHKEFRLIASLESMVETANENCLVEGRRLS